MPDDIGALCREMIENLKQNGKKMPKENKTVNSNPFAVFDDPDFPFGKNSPFKDPNFPFIDPSLKSNKVKCKFCAKEYDNKPESCKNCGSGEFES